MSIKRSLAAMALIGALVATTAACTGAADPSKAEGDPVKGGRIVAALPASPPTLDLMAGTTALTINVSTQIFEGLFAVDEDFVVRPMLAEGHEVSEDRLTYTITLRSGLTFHDGSPVTPQDVVASIERWGQVSGVGMRTFAAVKDVKAQGEDTVVISLKSQYEPLIRNLASLVQRMVVIPASVAKAAGTNPLSDDQVIGTGPYQLKSVKRGNEIDLQRFEDYAVRDEDWGGLAGKKEAWADSIVFRAVADNSARLNGLKTGEIDWADALSTDSLEDVEMSPDVDPLITSRLMLELIPNATEGVFADVEARRALNSLVDKTEIGDLALGSDKFWDADPAMFNARNENLHNGGGKDVYEEHDPKAAAATLQKLRKNSTDPIRILTSKTYPEYYSTAVALQQQLDEQGIKAKVEDYDFATMVEKRGDTSSWDITMTGLPLNDIDPTHLLYMPPTTYVANAGTQEMTDLMDQWVTTTDEGKQLDVVTAMQEELWSQLPLIKIVNMGELQGKHRSLHGFDDDDALFVTFWNSWKD